MLPKTNVLPLLFSKPSDGAMIQRVRVVATLRFTR